MAEMSILLAVSHPQLRKMVGKVLLRAGFTLLEAENAVTALVAIETLDGAIALVICDDELPEMNGTELTFQVKERLHGVPVLLFRSADFPLDADPADGFLCKPFGPAELVKVVRLLLAGPLE